MLPLSVVVNFLIWRAVTRHPGRPIYYLAGLVFNLALLCYYKYTGFFIEIINDAFQTELAYHEILLPLAISFFCFQQIAYLTDCRKQRVGEVGFWRYALFVTFFPQLICGPIVRFNDVDPQFDAAPFRRLDVTNINVGLVLFTIGLINKVLIARTRN